MKSNLNFFLKLLLICTLLLPFLTVSTPSKALTDDEKESLKIERQQRRIERQSYRTQLMKMTPEEREAERKATIQNAPARAAANVMAMPGETANCKNIEGDINEQDAFECLSSHRLADGEVYSSHYKGNCDHYITFYQRAMGISKNPITTPSCNILSKAIEKLDGEPPYWGDCVDNDKIGSAEHIYACLTRFLPKWNNTKFVDLKNCTDILNYYNTALDEGAKLYFLDSHNYSSTPLNKKIDCDIAGQAASLANNGKIPSWAMCMGYTPENAKEHIIKCLNSEPANFSSCTEGRSIYEKRLIAANGGKLPNSYTTASCDELKPILSQSVSVKEKPETIYTERPSQEYSHKKDSTSWGAWFFAFLVISIGGWWIWAAIKAKTIKAFLPHPDELPATNPTEKHKIINEMFDKKMGTLYFTGGFDETVPVQVSTNDGTIFRKSRVQAQFRIKRSIASMPHREREAARILELLINDGYISGHKAKMLRFGIIWGDGKAALDDSSFSVSVRVEIQNNMSEISDFINKYAKRNSVTNDGTVSEIFSLVEKLKAQHPNNPIATEVAGRLSGGNRWLTEKDIDGTPFFPIEGISPLFLGMGTDGGNFPIQYYGEGSLITVGPPGSGKTQCHAIPNLISWKGPAVVLDVTGDLWRQTSAWRKENVGPVFRFNPLDSNHSHSYNPLLEVRTSADHIWEDSRVIAEMLILNRNTTDPFWENSAKDVLTSVIAYICYFKPIEDRHFDTILDIISGVEWFDFLTESVSQTDIPSLRRAASSLSNLDEKPRSSIIQTAMTALSPWQGGQIPKVTNSSDWTAKNLRDGTNPTIYLCLSTTALKNYAGLVRVILAQHINYILNAGVDKTAPWIQFFLDELPQLGQMQPIQQALDVGRNHKIRLWMFAQYVSQLEEAYGKNIAHGMIGACAVRCYLNPSLADGTAEQIAKEIGLFESVIDSTRRKLVEPQELAGSEYKNRQIVLASGTLPARPLKVFSYSVEDSQKRIGEAKWIAISDARK